MNDIRDLYITKVIFFSDFQADFCYFSIKFNLLKVLLSYNTEYLN